MKYLSLVFILVSCNTPPRNIEIERCFPAMVKDMTIEGETYHTGYCRCHQYSIGENIGRTSESVNKPLKYCDKQATFINYPTTLYLFLQDWRVYLLQFENK